MIKTLKIKAALALLLAVFFCLGIFVWRKRQPSHLFNAKLITVRAIVKNSAGKPIQGASAGFTDAHGQEAGGPLLVIRLSGLNGIVDTPALFAAFPTRYTVVVNAGGYLASAPQTVSAWHDSTIYVILKKNPTHPPRSWIGGG